ncbi:MAG: hypothetical protein ACYS6I_04705, partial [Planctomycetota bacterium]
MLPTNSKSWMKQSTGTFLARLFVLALLCVACYGQLEKCTAKAGANDFYAYYTRLDYNIPVEAALGNIPRVEEEEEEEDDWAHWVRWDGGGPITGKYADIIVNIGKGRQLVFSRESSYLPYWKTKKGKWFVDELVTREKDVACLYSYARIIENTPEKILIHWRYMPDLAKLKPADVVHEYFAISPDGSVSRQVRQATGWVDEWTVTGQRLALDAGGIREVVLEPAHLVKTSDAPIQDA